jgi:hypothetical protein
VVINTAYWSIYLKKMDNLRSHSTGISKARTQASPRQSVGTFDFWTSEPHQRDADPDSDSDFYLMRIADPDPTFHLDADPDPNSSSIKDSNP